MVVDGRLTQSAINHQMVGLVRVAKPGLIGGEIALTNGATVSIPTPLLAHELVTQCVV